MSEETPLKFNFAHFGDDRSNRKSNVENGLRRKLETVLRPITSNFRNSFVVSIEAIEFYWGKEDKYERWILIEISKYF